MRGGAALALGVAMMVFAGCSAPAAPANPANIVVEGAWIAAPRGGDAASGFAKIRNTGASADRLLGVSTRRASMTMLHDMAITDGVMSMRAASAGFAVPGGGELALSPSGAHIMLMGISSPLQSGETVEMDLTFERAGRISVPFVVANDLPAPAHASPK